MMTSRSFRTSLLAILLGLVAAAATAETPKLRTVEFFSPAVNRTMKYNILLPSDYESSTRRYPVLYLLHGLTQNYTAWGLSNGAPFYAGLYDDLIVVMPDGGNSWYVNWAANEGGQKNNWEDIQSIGHIMAVQYEVMQRALGQRPFGRRLGTS